jgi:hypothetical protein
MWQVKSINGYGDVEMEFPSLCIDIGHDDYEPNNGRMVHILVDIENREYRRKNREVIFCREKNY